MVAGLATIIVCREALRAASTGLQLEYNNIQTEIVEGAVTKVGDSPWVVVLPLQFQLLLVGCDFPRRAKSVRCATAPNARALSNRGNKVPHGCLDADPGHNPRDFYCGPSLQKEMQNMVGMSIYTNVCLCVYMSYQVFLIMPPIGSVQ